MVKIETINLHNPNDYVKVYLPNDILQFCRKNFICVRSDNTVSKLYRERFQKLVNMFLVSCSSNYVTSMEYSEGFVYSFHLKSRRVVDYLFKKDSNEDILFFKKHLDSWLSHIDLAVINIH